MHPAEEQLIRFATLAEEAPDVSGHVATCSECTGEVAALRLLMTDLQQPIVWGDEVCAAEMPPSLGRIVERLSLERAAPTGGSAGEVERMNNEVLALTESEPAAAEALSARTVGAASKLDESYPLTLRAQLLGTAWKNRANVLRIMGDYSGALGALDHAEKAFRQSSASAYDLAIVDYVRATTHYFADHYADALSLARRAAEVFGEFGDNRRHSHARLLEGAVAFDSGDAAAARDVFYGLLPAAHADGDRATLARLFGNIAQCYINLGEHALATTYARQALSLYKQLGMQTEATRTGWIVGRLHAAAGENEDALDRLSRAEEQFLSLAMPVEASLVALDIAEVLLQMGERERVLELCRQVIGRFVAADLPERTRHAHALALESMRHGANVAGLLGATRDLLRELPATLTPESLN